MSIIFYWSFSESTWLNLIRAMLTPTVSESRLQEHYRRFRRQLVVVCKSVCTWETCAMLVRSFSMSWLYCCRRVSISWSCVDTSSFRAPFSAVSSRSLCLSVSSSLWYCTNSSASSLRRVSNSYIPFQHKKKQKTKIIKLTIPSCFIFTVVT